MRGKMEKANVIDAVMAFAENDPEIRALLDGVEDWKPSPIWPCQQWFDLVMPIIKKRGNLSPFRWRQWARKTMMPLDIFWCELPWRDIDKNRPTVPQFVSAMMVGDNPLRLDEHVAKESKIKEMINKMDQEGDSYGLDSRLIFGHCGGRLMVVDGSHRICALWHRFMITGSWPHPSGYVGF
jgi:hypothetical protein